MEAKFILALVLLSSAAVDAAFLRVGSRHYITVLTPSTQDQAITYCKSIGASIPTFTTQQELMDVKPLLGSDDFWLHGNNSGGGYRFAATGAVVSTDLWWGSEPSCAGNNCGIIVYTNSGKALLMAKPITASYKILCSIDLGSVEQIESIVSRLEGKVEELASKPASGSVTAVASNQRLSAIEEKLAGTSSRLEAIARALGRSLAIPWTEQAAARTVSPYSG